MSSSFYARALRIGTATRLAAAVIAASLVTAGCNSDTSTSEATARLVSPFSGDAQAAVVGNAVATPLVVLVSDGDSHGVAGVQVSFTATGGAVLSATTATTDSTGLASVTVTLGTKAGIDSVIATSAGLELPNAVFRLTAQAGAPTSIVAEAGTNDTTTTGSSLALVALVTDQYGNPVPNATIDWTASAGTLLPTEVSDSSGTAQDVIQFPAAPSVVTATATVDGTAIKATFIDTVN